MSSSSCLATLSNPYRLGALIRAVVFLLFAINAGPGIGVTIRKRKGAFRSSLENQKPFGSFSLAAFTKFGHKISNSATLMRPNLLTFAAAAAASSTRIGSGASEEEGRGSNFSKAQSCNVCLPQLGTRRLLSAKMSRFLKLGRRKRRLSF